MSTTNEDGKPPEKTDLKKEGAACCGPECGCGSGGRPGKWRWLIGAIVLVAAGVMVVRAVVKNVEAAPQTPEANPVATQGGGAGDNTNAEASGSTTETNAGATLETVAELNTATLKQDVIFVFLPARDGTSANAPLTAMKGAARALEAKGVTCGLFSLKSDSAEYNRIANEMPVPGVLTFVMGKGMSGISGEITEAKLLQGYMAASSASGCCSSVAAAHPCCPK